MGWQTDDLSPTDEQCKPFCRNEMICSSSGLRRSACSPREHDQPHAYVQSYQGAGVRAYPVGSQHSRVHHTSTRAAATAPGKNQWLTNALRTDDNNRMSLESHTQLSLMK